MGTNTAPYFKTDEQLKAKNWDMLQEAVRLRSRRAVLENELRKFAASWKELGRECSGSQSWVYKVGQECLSLLNPSQAMSVIGEIPWAHLDGEAIKRLFSDLQETAESLRALEEHLGNMGIRSF